MLNRISLKSLLIFTSLGLLVAMAALATFSNLMLTRIHDRALDATTLEKAMLSAKEARFQTIQVQQFLTDAAATAEQASTGRRLAQARRRGVRVRVAGGAPCGGRSRGHRRYR